jgi:hypothetical protein
MATASPPKSYRDFINRVTCPEARFERVLKEPGSKKLIFGGWETVKPEDDDALQP